MCGPLSADAPPLSVYDCFPQSLLPPAEAGPAKTLLAARGEFSTP
jgi:hypothetical protein